MFYGVHMLRASSQVYWNERYKWGVSRLLPAGLYIFLSWNASLLCQRSASCFREGGGWLGGLEKKEISVSSSKNVAVARWETMCNIWHLLPSPIRETFTITPPFTFPPSHSIQHPAAGSSSFEPIPIDRNCGSLGSARLLPCIISVYILRRIEKLGEKVYYSILYGRLTAQHVGGFGSVDFFLIRRNMHTTA